jgi:predicted alpha/beta superfamily hydrolase
MQRWTIALISCCVAITAAAGEPITIGESLSLNSKILGEDRTVLISPPADYARSRERYPVLYLTDGDAHLSHTRGTVDFLVMNGLMPDVIIVGVTNTDRTRDLSPTRANLAEDDGRVREFPTSGGAPRFLDFFETELMPFIDSHYRTEPFRLLAGHSFGGLFALDALFTRPELFDAVIAVGPSLRWDDDLPLRRAEAFVAGLERLDASLFVAMANEEADDPRPTRLDRLETTLAGSEITGFQWQVLRMPDETHGSAVLRAHYWGLRAVFAPWVLPTDPGTGILTGGAAGLKAHFSALSNRVGFEVRPPESSVNQEGYRLLLDNEVELAIEVFRYNVELYPNAANVYDSLGEALEQAGRLEEALDSYSHAVANAAGLKDPRLEIFSANRDRVRAALEQPGSK